MFKKIINEVVRYSPLVFIMTWAVWKFEDNSQLYIQLYQLSMTAFLVIVANIIRQVLFPYVRFYDLYRKARDNSLSSAIVIASFVFFMIAIIVVSTVRWH